MARTATLRRPQVSWRPRCHSKRRDCSRRRWPRADSPYATIPEPAGCSASGLRRLSTPAMARFRAVYDRWLRERPLATKALTSAALFGLGDRIAQRLEAAGDHQDREEDEWASLKRTGRMMVWGGLLFAPVGHAWYNVLEKVVRGKGRAAVVKKIALDQLVFTPPVTLAFFSAMQCMEGRPAAESLQTSVAKVPPTLAVNWTVWPLIHVCTFGFVPLQYRILFINVANIGWSTFLSVMSSSGGSDSFKAIVMDGEPEAAAI